MTVGVPSYKGFRFPAEIISHCVWLYFRFSLSDRDVEEMMLERGGFCREFYSGLISGMLSLGNPDWTREGEHR